MGLETSAEYFVIALQIMDLPEIPCEDFRNCLDQVFSSLLIELRNRLMFIVPSTEDAKYYYVRGASHSFWSEKVMYAFPDDAIEAGNCFAVGRYTACVFHLMRMMEKVVQEFATKVEATHKDGTPVEIKNEEWFQIEIAVSRAINNMPKGELKDKYSASLASLSAVRAGWRNLTMHPKQSYTEEQAKTLMDSVKLFIEAYSQLP